MSKIKNLVGTFISWRIIIFLLAIPAFFLLPLHPGFTSLSSINYFRNFFPMWANFNGANFLTMAAHGNIIPGNLGLLYSFSPVFPWLINTLNLVIHNYLASGLIISNLAFCLALYFLYLLFRLDYKEGVSKLALFLILIFPTSFFFGSVYAESVFLLFSVLSLYFARKHNFLLASIFAALTTLTNVFGVFLWPALAVEFYQAYGKKINQSFFLELSWFAIPLLIIISYLRFQFFRTGASIITVFTRAVAGPSQVTDKIVLIYQVFFRYAKMLIFMDHRDPLFITVFLEFIVGLGFLTLIIFSVKKIRPSYWLYCLPIYLLPTLSGTFSGLPRFVLVLFPLFPFLATLLDRCHPYLRYVYFVISFILSFFAISLFTRGYFVA
jgi:Gpi18-like mannosyltransferase